jgi:hypothetical protein
VTFARWLLGVLAILVLIAGALVVYTGLLIHAVLQGSPVKPLLHDLRQVLRVLVLLATNGLRLQARARR